MNVLNYSLRFRPLRIGWCLRQNDWDAYREILHLNFILAGGQFNPLIPIDDEDYARALIRTFRVDLLLCFPDDEKIHAFIAKFPHLIAPHMHRTFWENLYGSRIPPYVDISHPIRKYFGQACKNSPDYKLQCYNWKDNDPLAHVMLATWGKLRETSTQEFNYLGLLAQSVSIQSTDLTSDDPFPVPSGDPYLYIPGQLCRLGVEQHYRHSNRLRHGGLYLGHANNFQDLVNFWNLKATDLPIAFYDPSHTDRLRERKQDWLSFFPPFRTQTALNPAPMVLWGQTSEILIESGKWEIPVDRRVVNAVSWNGANIKVPYMYFSEHPVIGIQSASLSGNPKISIQRPPHPFDNEVLTQGQRMVVAIQPQSTNLTDHTTTLQLPFIPQLNTYYDRACHFGIGLACTRIEPDGIGFIQEIYDQNLSIAPVNVVELIGKLFASHGIKAELSDAGLTTQRLIHQMGGLQHCRLFKIRGVRKLIKQFGPTREFKWGDAVAFIRDVDEQTKKCSLDNYPHIYINGQKLDANGIMEAFLDKRVFSAGLKLSCPNCLLEFWAADRLPAPQSCEFCQHEFNILPFLKKNGAWHFRPSGLFAKGNDPKKGGDQKGAIPTILTLQQLEHSLGWGEMPYCASMNFEKISSPQWKCESDFVAILPKPNNEGKTELVIGECKSEGGEITNEDIEKLSTLADSLPEDQFRVYIVLSKLTSFSQEELNRIAMLNEHSTRAILFTTKELEALHPYEPLLQEHKQPVWAGKLQNMANITRLLILKDTKFGYPKTEEVSCHLEIHAHN